MPYDISEPNWDAMWEAECAFHEEYFGMGHNDATERNPWPEWFIYHCRDKASSYYYSGRLYALEEMIGPEYGPQPDYGDWAF